MLSSPRFDESNMPEHIAFGIQYEDKAREQFLKSHRFHHRKCYIEVPGLVLNQDNPFLGASPDGVLHCSLCTPDPSLLEIKCFSTRRNFRPATALVLDNVCRKHEDGSLEIRKGHRYYTQIQGQMFITGIHKCWLVAYTHKGIYPVHVEYDASFCEEMVQNLNEFYVNIMLPVMKAGRIC